MPFFQHANARLYFEDRGEGPAVVTTHGVAECRLYWMLPGIEDRLVAAGYRVISTDMRGHGRSTVTGAPRRFDVDTVAADFAALAEHLQLEGFHLLTHATGGNAGLRYAMSAPSRLLSLIATNTSSATFPTDAAAEVVDPTVRFDWIGPGRNPLAQAFRGRMWYQIIEGARQAAPTDVYLDRMAFAVEPEAAFRWYETCLRCGDPETLADFLGEFYTDADPRIAGLRAIRCPCLVLVGALDRMFRKPSEQLAREIPNARLVVLEGRGHMTAFEDPQATGDEILAFLATVTGRV
jgi:pimeloyl-ACP methyl ester carboxylesterase